MDNYELRSRLEALGVVSLMSAARVAGLKFRNGELNKAQIIDRLMNYPAMASATLATAQRAGGVTYTPPKVTPKVEDWTDDKAPAPAASAAERNGSNTERNNSPELETLRESIDTALRTLGRIDGQVQNICADYTTNRQVAQMVATGISAATSSIAETALRLVIEAAKAGKIPGIGETHIHFPPPAEAIKVEGLCHPKLPELIRVLKAGEQAFLKGPAGSGKTTAGKQVRDILAVHFNRPDYTLYATGAVSDAFALLGYKNATGEYVRTPFREAVEFGHPFLWDEIDASAPDAQLVVNALDNGFIAFPDATIPLHPHFRLIAGGNTDGSGATMEYSGRSRMDGAFRDRFAIIEWNLDPRIETHLSRGDSLWLECVRAVRAFAEKREIMDVVATARAVRRGPLFLHEGMARETVLEVTCKRGALVECWTDVLRLPAVVSFLRG